MQMLIIFCLLPLLLVPKFDVGFEVEFEIVKKVVRHVDFFKQVAMLHKVDV
jgi:hypothetical protein